MSHSVLPEGSQAVEDGWRGNGEDGELSSDRGFPCCNSGSWSTELSRPGEEAMAGEERPGLEVRAGEEVIAVTNPSYSWVPIQPHSQPGNCQQG